MSQDEQDFDEPPEEAVRRAELILTLRSRGIRDLRVLKAFESIPRSRFVQPELSEHAYADRSLPIPCGQTQSPPSLVATMTSELRVGDRDKVLEIGTGSGYQTAILARLARRIYTVDRYRTLIAQAERRFAEMKFPNVTAMVADGLLGWPQQAPFDRILVTAASETVPPALKDQLKDGGILIMPIGPTGGAQLLTRFQKIGQELEAATLLTVRFVPLVGGRAASL